MKRQRQMRRREEGEEEEDPEQHTTTTTVSNTQYVPGTTQQRRRPYHISPTAYRRLRGSSPRETFTLPPTQLRRPECDVLPELPDVIWLKISEYFSHHCTLITVSKTSKGMRKLFAKKIKQRRVWRLLLKSDMPDMCTGRSLYRLASTGRLLRGMTVLIVQSIYACDREIHRRRIAEHKQWRVQKRARRT